MTDAQFADQVRQIDYFANSSDGGIRQVGESMCVIFDPTTSKTDATVLWSAAVEAGRSQGLSLEDAGALVIWSVAAYCPSEFDYLPSA